MCTSRTVAKRTCYHDPKAPQALRVLHDQESAARRRESIGTDGSGPAEADASRVEPMASQVRRAHAGRQGHLGLGAANVKKIKRRWTCLGAANMKKKCLGCGRMIQVSKKGLLMPHVQAAGVLCHCGGMPMFEESVWGGESSDRRHHDPRT